MGRIIVPTAPNTARDVIDGVLRDASACGDVPWWIIAAAQAIQRGHWICIPRRNDRLPYLARYWLTPPKRDGDGYSSSDSVLLHQFLAGDDDHALHSHPYDFCTTILSGGYTEATAPTPPSHRHHGPSEDQWHRRDMRPGDRYSKDTTQLHAAEDPLPDTWSLFTTGPKTCSWGFHPPGRPWVPWKQFVRYTAVEVGRPGAMATA